MQRPTLDILITLMPITFLPGMQDVSAWNRMGVEGKNSGWTPSLVLACSPASWNTRTASWLLNSCSRSIVDVALEKPQQSLRHRAEAECSSLGYASFSSWNDHNSTTCTINWGIFWTHWKLVLIQIYNAPFLHAFCLNLWFLLITSLLKASIMLRSPIVWGVHKWIYGCCWVLWKTQYTLLSHQEHS